MEKTSSFKYTKLLKALIHVIISRNRRIFWSDAYNYKISTEPQGKYSPGFFRWKSDYGEHSKAIGKIINQHWKKGSVLYASAEYIDGKLEYHEPREPDIPDFGLARGHLINGYNRRWRLYQTVNAESVSICNEIKVTIESFEKIILDEMDKDILINNGNHRLERKSEQEVFTMDSTGSKLYPTKFNFNSLYLHPKILSEIFQEVSNRDNNLKEKREMQIREFGGICDIRFGKPNSAEYTSIGLGNREMMEELNRRVEKLLENSVIHQFVRDYNDKKSQLENRENANQLDREINHMWNEINSQNAFLKGEGTCQNSHVCRPKPKGSEEVYYVP